MQAWCKAQGHTTVVTDLKSELYTKYICKQEVIGVGDKRRKASFRYCATRICALRDLRLFQLSQGLYTAQQVTVVEDVWAGSVLLRQLDKTAVL